MNKLNKGKLLGIVAAGLSTVSLLGVGFAAWVINGGDNKDIGNIQITVADTKDDSIKFTSAGVSEKNSTIAFDAKKDDKTGPITGDGQNDEDLNFSIEYVLTCADASKFGGVKAYMTIAEAATAGSAGKALADAISAPNNYLIAPLSTSTSDTDKTTIASTLTANTDDSNADKLPNKKYSTKVSGTGPTYTFTTTFSFNWGTTFANQNPSIYATESNKGTVITALKALKNASNAKFTIHLEAVSKAA